MSKNDKKEDIPDYIAKHKKLYHHARKLYDTVAHTHSEAYAAAVNKHLLEAGEVDFDKLDDIKVQDQFVKTMSDMYISKAKAHFKVSKDLNDLEKDLLMQAYSGTTNQQLKQVVGKYGKRFTHQQFEAIKNQIQRNVGERLYASAGGHLTDEHVKEIVKHVGLENRVDISKVDVDEARQLLEVFHREGSVSDSTLAEILDSYKIKKKKEEKKK